MPQPGPTSINTSRGSVVDEAALGRAIREKRIRAALDVFPNEPAGAADFSNALVQAPGVYGTHHVGASTDGAGGDRARGHPDRPFSRHRRRPERATALAPKLGDPRPLDPPPEPAGVLAHVFTVLAGAAINVEEVENIIYHGAQATLVR